MEILIGVIGLLMGLILAITPYFRSKYFLRPEVTIEMTSDGGMSLSKGFSAKNKVNEEGLIDDNNAIKVFELTWLFKVKITNNSDLTAFYPQLEFNPNGPKFKMDEINVLQPLKPAESIEFNAQFLKYEEATGKDKTKTGNVPPPEFKDLEIVLRYENSKKRRFYTLFQFNVTGNRNIFLRSKPKNFQKKKLTKITYKNNA